MQEIELKELLLKEIVETKDFKNLGTFYPMKRLEMFVLTNGDVFKKLKIHVKEKGLNHIEKNKFFKEIVKSVRSDLRVVYSSFLSDKFSRKEHLLDKVNNEQGILELLKLHKSTNERVNFYEEIYEKIFSWYEPKKIADVACGLNPLSYFIAQNILGYNFEIFASDLSSHDMDFLNSFFDKFKIKGKAKSYDVTDLSILEDKEFQTCDLVFLFKALDSFEEIQKNVSKSLILGIKANRIVVSFPTKSLGQKKGFDIKKRNWFFNFLNKEEFKYETFEVENELFVLVEK